MLNRITGPARRFLPETEQAPILAPYRGRSALSLEDRPRRPGRYATAGTSAGTVAADLSGAIVLSGVITPSNITADQNDYSPTGISDASIVRLSASSGFQWIITGLVGGEDGRILVLRNVSTSSLFCITHEDTDSSAENRFSVGSGGCALIMPNRCATVQYDGATSRWVLLWLSDNGWHRSNGDSGLNSSISSGTQISDLNFGAKKSGLPEWVGQYMCAYTSAATTTGAGVYNGAADYHHGVATLTATTEYRHFGLGSAVSTTSLTAANIALGDFTVSGTLNNRLEMITEVDGSAVTNQICFIELKTMN